MLIDTARWLRGLLALVAIFSMVSCSSEGSTDDPSTVTDTSDIGSDAADSSETSTDETVTDETGADETGTDETGTDETGTDETGTDETGTDETGTDETGTDETGIDETGTDETGTDETGIDETSPDSFADRPFGQCTSDMDCKAQNDLMYCNRAHPGGVCLGCGTDDQCPGDTVCYVGSCVQECSALTDCPPGLYCTGAGRCGASWCVDDTCTDALYGCGDTGRCARASCVSGDDCPAQTTCVDGLCIEDREIG